MIEVRQRGRAWMWAFVAADGTVYRNADAYPTSAHALRDAWTWSGGATPAFIYPPALARGMSTRELERYTGFRVAVRP